MKRRPAKNTRKKYLNSCFLIQLLVNAKQLAFLFKTYKEAKTLLFFTTNLTLLLLLFFSLFLCS